MAGIARPLDGLGHLGQASAAMKPRIGSRRGIRREGCRGIALGKADSRKWWRANLGERSDLSLQLKHGIDWGPQVLHDR